jgi:UDP-N-acetylmuramoyl-tripeptide--D-alanyl-D-alanine ligase
MGCDEKNIRAGLTSYVAGDIRQNISEKSGVIVIADCYNAAPESMRASLDVLGSLGIEGKRVAVLGDMRELGKMSASLHFEVGKYAAEHGVDMLFTLGELGAEIAVGALTSGLDTNRVFVEKNIDNIDYLADKIRSSLTPGDVILFKASRALALERIIEKIF